MRCKISKQFRFISTSDVYGSNDEHTNHFPQCFYSELSVWIPQFIRKHIFFVESEKEINDVFPCVIFPVSEHKVHSLLFNNQSIANVLKVFLIYLMLHNPNKSFAFIAMNITKTFHWAINKHWFLI